MWPKDSIWVEVGVGVNLAGWQEMMSEIENLRWNSINITKKYEADV